MFELIPCLVIGKGSVWLPPGNGTEVVSRNPLRVGLRFKALGAKILYVVDLDSAQQEPSVVPAALLGLSQAGLELWTGGGIRSADQARKLLAAGADSVVVHTISGDRQRLQQLVETVGAGRVIVSVLLTPSPIDPESTAPGQGDNSTIQVAESLGISRFIVSANTPRAGHRGINIAGLKSLVLPGRWIGAGSGIRTSSDLLRLQRAGIDAAIVGRALYDHPLDHFWDTNDSSTG